MFSCISTKYVDSEKQQIRISHAEQKSPEKFDMLKAESNRNARKKTMLEDGKKFNIRFEESTALDIECKLVVSLVYETFARNE